MLRGLAALAVCVFHFTKYLFPPSSSIRMAGSFGWAGVESFFVVSGFVIPYAMHRSGYTLNAFAVFNLKRFVRLAPPYYASVLIALALAFLSTLAPGFAGKPFAVEWTRWLAHALFLNDLLGVEWLNPVYWTLAIEFQYYLLISLVYPLLFYREAWVRCVSICVFALTTWLPTSIGLVTNFSLIFLSGILVSQYYTGLISKRVVGPLFVCLGLAIYVHHGGLICFVTAISVLTIVLIDRAPKWSLFLGQLSYALYLVHVPVGGRIVNFSHRFAGESDTLLLAIVLLLAIACSLAVAYVLYQFIERPALKSAATIKY